MPVDVKDSAKPHLLVVRLSAMGDVAMAVPLVRQFRADNPDVKITILTRPFFQPFFRDVPGIGFLSLDLNGRHKGFFGIVRLWRDAEAVGITHVADIHDVLRTKILRRFCLLSGNRVAVIDKGRKGKKALTRKYGKVKVQLETTVNRYRDTFLKLGFNVFAPVPAGRHPVKLNREVEKIAGEKTGLWIGVAPFAAHRGKIYPPAHIDELIGMLVSRYEKVFVFGGGEYEKEFAETMQKRHEGVVSVIGKISLDGELDLISNLDAMISMDSSAMHMASLVGTPVVSIWGATHPYAGFMGFGQDPDDTVQLDLPCRPCSVYGNKPCIYGNYRCLENITPAMIADKVASVLN